MLTIKPLKNLIRVEAKLNALILLTVILFFGAFFGLRAINTSQAQTLYSNEASQKKLLSKKVIKFKGASLEAVSIDYTYWDEFVNFLHTHDENWAKQNIDPALKTFKINAAWIYDLNG